MTVLKTEYSNIGPVHQKTATDGVQTFVSESISLDSTAMLLRINGNFYIDTFYALYPLDKRLAMKYNIDKFFEFTEDDSQKEPPKKRKARR